MPDYNRVAENPEKYLTAAFSGHIRCFQASKSDTEYLVDPDSDNPNQAVVSAAISLSRADEDVKVEQWNGVVTIIPAGTLKAGEMYRLHIVKLFSTDTGASVKVLIWQGDKFIASTPSIFPTVFP